LRTVSWQIGAEESFAEGILAERREESLRERTLSAFSGIALYMSSSLSWSSARGILNRVMR
jgi:hypothetical protein